MKQLLLCTIYLFVFSVAHAQLEKKIDSLMTSQFTTKEFSGSVLVTKNNKEIYNKQFGFGDLETKRAISKDTKFSLGSIPKMMTGTVILKLVEENKLKLHEPINTYLPEWKVPNGDSITIHHLLTHSSGLGDYMSTDEFQQLSGKQSTIDNLMKIIVAQPLSFRKPGSKFRYCNSGFVLMGKIIEKIEGKPYFTVLNNRIFKPAGMKNTTPVIDLTNKTFAKGYVKKDGEWKPQLDIIPPSADGGLFSTTKDLFLFDRALAEGKLISKAMLEMMRKPQMGPSGYATIITSINNGVGYGHNGGLPGYQADYRHYYVGKDEYTAIVFSNRDFKAIPILKDIQNLISKQ
jgi:CubicO group peptidase (beta-lactamase class C family)